MDYILNTFTSSSSRQRVASGLLESLKENVLTELSSTMPDNDLS